MRNKIALLIARGFFFFIQTPLCLFRRLIHLNRTSEPQCDRKDLQQISEPADTLAAWP